MGQSTRVRLAPWEQEARGDRGGRATPFLQGDPWLHRGQGDRGDLGDLGVPMDPSPRECLRVPVLLHHPWDQRGRGVPVNQVCLRPLGSPARPGTPRAARCWDPYPSCPLWALGTWGLLPLRAGPPVPRGWPGVLTAPRRGCSSDTLRKPWGAGESGVGRCWGVQHHAERGRCGALPRSWPHCAQGSTSTPAPSASCRPPDTRAG